MIEWRQKFYKFENKVYVVVSSGSACGIVGI